MNRFAAVSFVAVIGALGTTAIAEACTAGQVEHALREADHYASSGDVSTALDRQHWAYNCLSRTKADLDAQWRRFEALQTDLERSRHDQARREFEQYMVSAHRTLSAFRNTYEGAVEVKKGFRKRDFEEIADGVEKLIDALDEAYEADIALLEARLAGRQQEMIEGHQRRLEAKMAEARLLRSDLDLSLAVMKKGFEDARSKLPDEPGTSNQPGPAVSPELGREVPPRAELGSMCSEVAKASSMTEAMCEQMIQQFQANPDAQALLASIIGEQEAADFKRMLAEAQQGSMSGSTSGEGKEASTASERDSALPECPSCRPDDCPVLHFRYQDGGKRYTRCACVEPPPGWTCGDIGELQDG